MDEFNSMNGIVKFFRVEQEIQRAILSGKIQDALRLYDEMLKIKSRYPNRLGYAKTLSEKAFLLESNGFTQEAVNLYSQAASIANNSASPAFRNELLRNVERTNL